MQSHMSYLSCSCFVCLTGPYKFEYLVLEQLTFGSLSTIFSYCMFNMAPHGKEFSEDLRIRIVALHKDGLGYTKNSVTPWQYSGQGHTEVFQEGFHSEQASQGSIKEVESLCCVSGAEAGFKKQTHECCQHCFRGCRSGRSVIRPYATHCNKSVCMAIIP